MTQRKSSVFTRSSFALSLSFFVSLTAAVDIEASISEGLSASEWSDIQNQLPTAPSSADLPVTQPAYLKASNTDEGDRFAWDLAVAVDGDTVVIGAHYEGSDSTGVNGDEDNNNAERSGAVYVFVRSDGSWSQQAYLKASNTDVLDQFGRSVGINGDTIVVGAPFESSNATGINGDQTNNALATSGAAYVFVRSNGSWSQQAYLKASNTGFNDQFGSSVAVDGETVVVGAALEDSNATGINGNQANNGAENSGAAYVFLRSDDSWIQQAYLKASNTEADDEFGRSVALSGDIVAVGTGSESSNATGVDGDQANNDADAAGAVYAFNRNGESWSQQAYLKASNAEAGDFFGESIAADGSTIVVGARLEDSGATTANGDETDNDAEFAGAAYVFVRSGESWSQQAYLKASNNEANDRFGTSVAVHGNTVVVAASLEDSNATGVDGNQANNSADRSGAAYVFSRSGANWSQRAYLKASNTERQDQFGASLAIADTMVVIGARFEDSNATGVDGDQANNDADGAGAAYVFDLRLIFDKLFADRFEDAP